MAADARSSAGVEIVRIERPQALDDPAQAWALSLVEEVAGSGVYAADGSLERIVHLPVTPRPLLDSEKAEIRRVAAQNHIPFDPNDRYHTHWRPALRLETVDDSLFAVVHRGNLLAAHDPAPGQAQEVWRLIAATCSPAGNLVFPVRFTPWEVLDDHAVGAQRDSLDIAAVRVLAVTRVH